MLNLPSDAPQPPQPPQHLLTGPIKPPAIFKSFDDVKSSRQSIYDSVLKAARNVQPIDNGIYKLALEDVDYLDDGEADPEKVTAAKLKGRTLERRLGGTWRMYDQAGKVVSEKKQTVGAVPIQTDFGAFINRGNAMLLRNQQRLRAGLYARKKQNGELECFHRNTLIWTEQGEIPIGDIVDQKLRVRVWSYDFTTQSFVLRPITNWFRNRTRQGLGKASFNSHSAAPSSRPGPNRQRTWVTADHKVFNANGGKTSVSESRSFLTVEDLPSSAQEQLLLGSLLGDGHVCEEGLFDESHGVDQREYVRFKTHVLGELACAARAEDSVPRFASKQWAYLRDLRKLCYPDGKKQVSREWLDRLDERALAVWFCDDGCGGRAANQRGVTSCAVVRIATHGFNQESIKTIAQWFRDRWGLAATFTRSRRTYGDRDLGWQVHFNGEDAETFLDLVAPYVHPSLAYKLGPRPVSGNCDCGAEIQVGRMECNRCLLAACVGAPPDDFSRPAWVWRGNKRSQAKYRFGSRENLTAILESGEVPDDGCRAARWDARDQVAGSRIDEMLNDSEPRKVLREVRFDFESDPAKLDHRCRTRYAYDITVEGTHNYFANGMLVSNCHANFLPGQGLTHRYGLDPEKGVFYSQFRNSNIPMYSMLRAMGAGDEEIKDAWGEDLWKVNKARSRYDDDVRRLASQVLPAKEIKGDFANVEKSLRERLTSMKLDPETTSRTLKEPHTNLTPRAALLATKRLIAIAKGEDEPDSRDAMAFQEMVYPDKLFAERIAKDYAGEQRKMLFKATQKGNLDWLPNAPLRGQIYSALLNSGLGQMPEAPNPLEMLDRRYSVTRLGEGGISGGVDSIPDEARNVSSSHNAFLDAWRTPESLRVGVDLYFSNSARRGPDDKFYASFIDAKTRQPVMKTPEEIADSVVGFPQTMRLKWPRVPVIKNGKEGFAKPSEIDVFLPSLEHSFSPMGNLIPLKSESKGQRAAMGSRMLTQALPVLDAEAPLVRTAVPGTNEEKDYYTEYGKHAGAVFAEEDGRVVSVDAKSIKVWTPNGTKNIPLYSRLPLNQKTALIQTAVVKPGDAIKAGQPIAKSNFTDATGAIAVGKNLRTLMVPNAGMDFEDAFIVSESAAKKLASQQTYQKDIEPGRQVRRGRNTFVGLFPNKYTRAQLGLLDEDGVAKVGTRVSQGDPLMLAVRDAEATHSKVHKRKQPSAADASVAWDHEEDGVVVDVVDGRHGKSVVVETISPLRVGSDERLFVRDGTLTMDEQVPSLVPQRKELRSKGLRRKAGLRDLGTEGWRT